MFTAEEIRERVREIPFTPLRIFTSSGQSYDITHPELVFYGRRALHIGVASNDNPSIFETATRVAIMHITDLQEVPKQTSATNHGSA